MTNKNKLLAVKDLYADIISARGLYHAVRGVSFDINENEILGIVGESGCGKSMTAKSILRLNDEKKTFYRGAADYYGKDGAVNLLSLPAGKMDSLRGIELALISQNPMAAFDPLYTVGEQIEEMIRHHKKVSASEAHLQAVKLMETVGISPGEERSRQYPHEFSGGMLQRAAIAMMISCGPRLLIADEPTTALDVTMQAQILGLIKRLNSELNMSVMIITHNFGVVAEICDRVCVMYAGQIVESGSVEEIFRAPAHPYTRALIKGIPRKGAAGGELATIPGAPPRLDGEIKGCAFVGRCSQACGVCRISEPGINIINSTDGINGINGTDVHWYKCHKIYAASDRTSREGEDE